MIAEVLFIFASCSHVILGMTIDIKDLISIFLLIMAYKIIRFNEWDILMILLKILSINYVFLFNCDAFNLLE